MTELYAVAATAAESDVPGRPDIGPGSLGFWIVIALIVVLFFLYRSMRKQIRRVDFDPDAATDAERIASHREPGARDAEDSATDRRATDDREPHDHRS